MRAGRAQAIRRPHAQIEFVLRRRDSHHVSGHRECRVASRAPLDPSGAREGRVASEVPTLVDEERERDRRSPRIDEPLHAFGILDHVAPADDRQLLASDVGPPVGRLVLELHEQPGRPVDDDREVGAQRPAQPRQRGVVVPYPPGQAATPLSSA